MSRGLLSRVASTVLLLGSIAPASAADDFSDLVSKAPLSDTLDALNREQDSCRFIDPATVEAFAHDKLALPPIRSVGSRPDPHGTDCRYWFSRFRSIDVSVAQHGGDKVFAGLKTVGTVLDQAFETSGRSMRTLGIEGDWDEIILLPHDGIGALQGDVLATIAFFGLRPKTERAVPLMNALYTHLGKPLEIDGTAGISAATEADLKRPKPRDPCGLVAQSDIERILGTPMTGPPRQEPLKSDRTGCSWSYSAGGLTRTFAYQVTWRDGYDALDLYRTTITKKVDATRRIHDLLASNASAAGGGTPSVKAEPLRTPAGPGWDFAVLGAGEMAAVKSDVLVWTYAPAATDDQLMALMTLALSDL